MTSSPLGTDMSVSEANLSGASIEAPRGLSAEEDYEDDFDDLAFGDSYLQESRATSVESRMDASNVPSTASTTSAGRSTASTPHSRTTPTGGTSSVTLNEATGVVTTTGSELKTNNVTLKIPKGSLDKETFIHLYEIGNDLVKTLDTAGLTEGIDFLLSPMISIAPSSTFLRRSVHLKVRNLFPPYPLDATPATVLLLLNKTGNNDKNATDGWENVADSRLYTSISWRLRETCVEVETKFFGDFHVVVLFSTPLPLLLSYVRLESFHVHFAVVLTRHKGRKRNKEASVGGEEEEGVLMTLVVSTDPGRCAQLEEFRQNRDRYVVIGPSPSLMPLCDGFPFEFFLLHCFGDFGAAVDSINADKCRNPSSGQQRSVFVPDSAFATPALPFFVDVLCVSSSHPLPSKKQVPLCEFLELTDSSLRKGISLLGDPSSPRRESSGVKSKSLAPSSSQPASSSVSGAVAKSLAAKRKSVGFLVPAAVEGNAKVNNSPPVFGVGVRLGPRHFLTHWSAIDAAYRFFRSSSGASTLDAASSSENDGGGGADATDWEVLQSTLQRCVRISFGEVPTSGMEKGGGRLGQAAAAKATKFRVADKKSEKELISITGVVVWDITFTIKWVVLELHGSEKRFPASMEQHVNVSAIKTGNVIFFGHSGVKVIGGKADDLEEAVIQSMKKRQREDVLRKVVENRGQVLSNDDKQLVRNPAVTIIQTQNKICLPGSPGFDSEGKLSIMYCKGFGRLETAVTLATVRDSMASQADGNEAKQNLVNAILPNAWNG